MSFTSLNLSSKLLKRVEELGYTTPTEIQTKAIPILLQQKDLLATSQTGTGKTAAFVFPLLENLKENPTEKKGDERYKIDALILAPTRELVVQIDKKIKSYAKNYSHKSVALYGGVGVGSQVSQIRAGANIAVGTTSRVLEHIKKRTLNLSNVQTFILDEADKMLEMGFIDEIRTILGHLPKKRHSVMFSATFSSSIRNLANSFLDNPVTITIDKEQMLAKEIKQKIYLVNEEEKIALLLKLTKQLNNQQCIIFTNTKRQADTIVNNFKEEKINALAIHGDKSQNMRTVALKKFKEGKVNILVATDVAARGIDIAYLPYVINFELPNKSEEYVHRVGRTGRAGEKGEALSLVSQEELEKLKEIEELIGEKIKQEINDNFSFTKQITSTNTKKRKTKNKEEVNLKLAKEIAKKMLGEDNSTKKGTKNKRKRASKSPRNKRHF